VWFAMDIPILNIFIAIKKWYFYLLHSQMLHYCN
jgi:hypothetical protein